MSELLSSVIAGLLGAVSGMLVVAFMAYRREKQLNVERFRFRFLRFRDEFRYLAATGELDPRVPTYTLMISLLNIAIKNAGTMRLRDLPAFAEMIDQRVRRTGEVAWKDFRSQSAEVHRLVAQIFMELGKLMLANDPIIGWVIMRGMGSRGKSPAAFARYLDRLSSRILPQSQRVAAERARGMFSVARSFEPSVDDETLDLWQEDGSESGRVVA